MIYLVEYNNKIIGAYKKYKLAKLFILSCYQNNFMIHEAKIISIKDNSCYQITTCNIDNNNNNDINNNNNINNDINNNNNNNNNNNDINDINDNNNNNLDELIDENNNKLTNILTDVNNINNKLNSLKIIKNKIEEYKNIFDVDIKLYDLFNDKINNDNNFVIPELFIEKFNIIKKLNDSNNLSLFEYINQVYNISLIIDIDTDTDNNDDDNINNNNIYEEFEI